MFGKGEECKTSRKDNKLRNLQCSTNMTERRVRIKGQCWKKKYVSPFFTFRGRVQYPEIMSKAVISKAGGDK